MENKEQKWRIGEPKMENQLFYILKNTYNVYFFINIINIFLLLN